MDAVAALVLGFVGFVLGAVVAFGVCVFLPEHKPGRWTDGPTDTDPHGSRPG